MLPTGPSYAGSAFGLTAIATLALGMGSALTGDVGAGADGDAESEPPASPIAGVAFGSLRHPDAAARIAHPPANATLQREKLERRVTTITEIDGRE